MPDLFLFGTLRHRPLLELVLGRAEGRLSGASLTGHRVAVAKGHGFPVLASGGEGAEGLLLEGLTDDDLSRIDFYESAFGYEPRVRVVDTDDGKVGARVYFPVGDQVMPGGPWDLQRWEETEAQLALHAAEEVMSLFGQINSSDLRHRFPVIQARAWSRQLALTRPQPATRRSPAGAAAEELKDRHGGFHGFFRMRPISASYNRFDGSRAGPVEREVFHGFDAALVLPYDPVRDQVHLVEQFRYGPAMRGDPCPRVFEPIAGMVDAGEDPIETARREAIEEAGLVLTDLRPVGGVYASPGYSTDFFHCFLAICDLDRASGRVGGHPNEDEDILSHVLSFETAMSLLDSGEINVGPLVMMLLWLSRERETLRVCDA